MFGNQLFKTSRKVSKKQTPATRTRIRIAIQTFLLVMSKNHMEEIFSV